MEWESKTSVRGLHPGARLSRGRRLPAPGRRRTGQYPRRWDSPIPVRAPGTARRRAARRCLSGALDARRRVWAWLSLFNFYAALPYYLAAGLRLLGWGPIHALQAVQGVGFVLSAAAMALLARRVFRRPAAVALAVVAYTCAPFHLVNVYVRGDSLSEFYALSFIR